MVLEVWLKKRKNLETMWFQGFSVPCVDEKDAGTTLQIIARNVIES